MMKKLLACLLIVLMSLTFVGCGQGNETSEAEKTVNIGVMPDVESIPFIIAQKNGYFEQEGVKVNIEHFKSAQDRDSALQSGQLDGVVSDMVAIVFANEGGFDLRMISKTNGKIALLAGKDSNIQSVEQLDGKRLGLSMNTVMEYTADKMLAKNQFSPDIVEKVAIPKLPARLEMIQNGKIEAAILNEPLAGIAVKDGAQVLYSTEEIGDTSISVAFTEKSLQDKNDEIKAVFRAYNKAVDYLKEEPASSYIDYIIEEQGFPESLKDSIYLPAYRHAELPDEEVFNDVIQWLQNKNLIEKEYKYADLINDEILR